MNRRSILLLAAVLTIGVLRSGAASAVPFETVSLARLGGILAPSSLQAEVVQSQEELESLWRSLGRTIAPPEVDFRGHALVGVFLGMRGSSGYRVEVEDVQVRAGTMVVSVVETAPGPCCVVTFGATKPETWFLTVPWKHAVEVEVRRVERNCCP